MKLCQACGAQKPLTEYHRNKGCKDGHLNECRACVNARRAAKVESTNIHGVERGQRWVYEGQALTVLCVTTAPGGGYRAVYREGRRNRTIPIEWLLESGVRHAL